MRVRQAISQPFAILHRRILEVIYKPRDRALSVSKAACKYYMCIAIKYVALQQVPNWAPRDQITVHDLGGTNKIAQGFD